MYTVKNLSHAFLGLGGVALILFVILNNSANTLADKTAYIRYAAYLSISCGVVLKLLFYAKNKDRERLVSLIVLIALMVGMIFLLRYMD